MAMLSDMHVMHCMNQLHYMVIKNQDICIFLRYFLLIVYVGTMPVRITDLFNDYNQ